MPIKPGLTELLEWLKVHGYQIALATSTYQASADRLLDIAGVSPYYTCRVYGDMVEHGKPAPDVYLEAASRLQARPEHCLVFEDVPMGILAGKNAGMRVCAVEDAFSVDCREEKQELADYYISDYYEIL